MSLIVTAYTQEGIVIGADSCITTNFTQEGKELYKHSHCGNKLFLLNKKIGISTCGDAIINGILLSSLIDQYIWSKKEENITLLQVEIDLKNIVNNQAKGKEYYFIYADMKTGKDMFLNLTITIKKAISKMFLNVTAVFMMGK